MWCKDGHSALAGWNPFFVPHIHRSFALVHEGHKLGRRRSLLDGELLRAGQCTSDMDICGPIGRAREQNGAHAYARGEDRCDEEGVRQVLCLLVWWKLKTNAAEVKIGVLILGKLALYRWASFAIAAPEAFVDLPHRQRRRGPAPLHRLRLPGAPTAEHRR